MRETPALSREQRPALNWQDHPAWTFGLFPLREELGAVINFGSSVGHIPVRGAVMQGGEATPFSVAADPCCMLETKQFSQGACVVCAAQLACTGLH